MSVVLIQTEYRVFQCSLQYHETQYICLQWIQESVQIVKHRTWLSEVLFYHINCSDRDPILM